MDTQVQIVFFKFSDITWGLFEIFDKKMSATKKNHDPAPAVQEVKIDFKHDKLAVCSICDV